MIRFGASRTASVDLDERDTNGFMVAMQVGPFVFEFWVARRAR